MISFDQENRIFKLDTPNSSYVVGIFEQDYLLNLYYGKRIPDNAGLWQQLVRIKHASFSPANPHFDDEEYSVDVLPLEYSCNGSGDMRIAALSVRNKDGNDVTDVRYLSHRIYKGKPEIPSMPALYTESDEDADTLEIDTIDAYTGVKATLIYTAFNNFDAITKSVRIENTGSDSVNIERVFSSCVELPSMDFDLITLYGTHCKERSREQRPLAHGVQGIKSKRGSSSHTQNPFAALLKHDATEDNGEAYGFNLVYSGNFEFCAECDFSGATRILMGINPDSFSWLLAPGETFCTPETVMVYTDKGLGEMSRIYHRLYLKHLIRGEWKNKKRPLLINSWEAAYFDFDADKLVSFAKTAKEDGIEMLVMDDGWFGHRNCDDSSLGDWYVNEEKLPGGLGELVRRVNDVGMKFGIWYEPEMISPDSDLYRAHPDWCVHVKGRETSVGRRQYVIDMTRQDVRDNIFNQMYAELSKCNIEYLKWDFNRNISEAGSALLDPEHSGEFFHRFVLGTYDLMDRITKAFPHILMENCSGGGGRFDPGMLYYSPMIWTSDNTDPIERLTIQFGTSMCYPASTMGAHVSACDRTGYRTKGDVALWGSFGYELDPLKLSDEDREIVREQVKEFHKYYDLTHYGDLYRIIDPYFNKFRCAWALVSPDKSEALTTIVAMRRPETQFFIFKFKGLDPEKYYECDLDGKVYSGALLMNAGLNLTRKVYNTGDSMKIYLKECK